MHTHLLLCLRLQYHLLCPKGGKALAGCQMRPWRDWLLYIPTLRLSIPTFESGCEAGVLGIAMLPPIRAVMGTPHRSAHIRHEQSWAKSVRVPVACNGQKKKK